MLSTPTGDIPFAEAVQMHAAADSVMMALFISVSDWDGCEVIRRFQSEKVYEVDCSLSHAEIIVGLVLLDLLSASGATEAVETGVGPTYSISPLCSSVRLLPMHIRRRHRDLRTIPGSGYP